MKRIISMLLSILLLSNNVLAYTTTIKAKGLGMVITSKPGNTVTVISKTEEITGWEVEEGNITIENNQFVTPEENVKIKGVEAKEKYIFKLIFPYFTNEEKRAEGEVISIEALSKTGEYIFKNWSAEGIEITEEQKVNSTLEFIMPANAVTITANYEELPWNAPVIAEGLIPVNWNGSTWIETTESEWDYNYDIASSGHEKVEGDGTGKWANAQTSDGSLYVWIPRYTYKITSGYHEDVDSWSSMDTVGTGKIEIKFSDGIEDEVTEGAINASEGYVKHPAFTFGTDELEGIWVAKYEASRNDATSSSVGSGTIVSSKPGVVSWTNTTISDMYDCAYNLNRSLDSHLMKNSEWGAVAYLTNAIGKIPYVNNSSTLITGNAGGSQDATSATGVTNAWNTINGVKASTTHNVYGIYDLSGGAYEYISAYVNNGNASLESYASNLVSSYNTYGSKYVDVYSPGTTESNVNNYATWTEITGDAMYETSSNGSGTTSWDGDYSHAPNSSNPIFRRGGGYNNLSQAGIFSFAHQSGNSIAYYSFRAVLSIPAWYKDATKYTVTFNANGGSGTMDTQTFIEGVVQNLNENKFTKEGYILSGWAITADGEEKYKNSEAILISENTTLYAKWEEDKMLDIPIGSYIAYTPSKTTYTVPQTQSGWLYDQNYEPSSYSNGWQVFKNNNGQVDIISSESIGSLRFRGVIGYVNAVDTLNNMCQAYVNSIYANSGRSLGYLEGSSIGKINETTHPITWTNTYKNGNTGFPYNDTYYTSDITIINTAINGEYPLRHTGLDTASYTSSIWLASRTLLVTITESNFNLRRMTTDGGVSGDVLYCNGTSDNEGAYDVANGVRPIISLKRGLKIIGGTGTADNPYIISN